MAFSDEHRLYSLERVFAHVIFKCRACSHTVTTLKFNAAFGNVRTQAAIAMTKHVEEVQDAQHTSLRKSQLP
jgi:hypothetical protein